MQHDYNTALVIGGGLSAIASLQHVGIIIGGAPWYRFFGAGERMATAVAAGRTYPALVTASIAAAAGSAELAASYAAHIMGVNDHYRWRALLGERQAKKDTKSLTGYLAETDAWLGRKLKSAARELEFWAR